MVVAIQRKLVKCSLLALECCNCYAGISEGYVLCIVCTKANYFPYHTANKHSQRVTSHRDPHLRMNLADQMIADRLRLMFCISRYGWQIWECHNSILHEGTKTHAHTHTHTSWRCLITSHDEEDVGDMGKLAHLHYDALRCLAYPRTNEWLIMSGDMTLTVPACGVHSRHTEGGVTSIFSGCRWRMTRQGPCTRGGENQKHGNLQECHGLSATIPSFDNS